MGEFQGALVLIIGVLGLSLLGLALGEISYRRGK